MYCRKTQHLNFGPPPSLSYVIIYIVVVLINWPLPLPPVLMLATLAFDMLKAAWPLIARSQILDSLSSPQPGEVHMYSELKWEPMYSVVDDIMWLYVGTCMYSVVDDIMWLYVGTYVQCNRRYHVVVCGNICTV